MIAAVRLQQFRSYHDKTVEFSPGVNIIVGPNASGKTNLLEAVMVVCRGSSYRAPDSELIMHGKKWARIDGQTDYGPRTIKLIKGNKTAKELIVNNKSYKRITASGQLPLVLFEPNHLLMLSGPPELRRAYMDSILELVKPGYKKTLSDYKKTLKQRNHLLKTQQATANNLFPWNIRLSHLGGYLAYSRNEIVTQLNKNVSRVYSTVSNNKEKISLRYNSCAALALYESQLLKLLESDLDLDLRRGFTGKGPHREDMEVLIGGREPSSFASRGEARSVVVALKILESNVISHNLNLKPILLFDDVFSELDTKRRQALTQLLDGHQSLITTTDADKAILIDKKAKIIKTTN